MWDFIVRVVCERECENSRHYWRQSGFHKKFHEKPSREMGHMQSTWLECEESWQLVFMIISRVRPSCKILVRHSVFLFWHICYTMSLPTLYISSLPTYCKECFSERNSEIKPLRVRNCYIYNPLHNPLWFSLTPTFPYPYPWEVDSPNTYHTQSECKVRFWCCWEALEEAKC